MAFTAFILSPTLLPAQFQHSSFSPVRFNPVLNLFTFSNARKYSPNSNRSFPLSASGSLVQNLPLPFVPLVIYLANPVYLNLHMIFFSVYM